MFIPVTTARTERDCKLIIAGQSLADYLTYSGGAWEMAEVIKTGAVSQSIASVEIRDQAVGGSFAVKAHRDTFSPSSNFWWDVQANSAGPLLTTAVAAINDMAVKPHAIVWDQGQADTDAAAGTDGYNASQAVADYTAATLAIFQSLRSAVNPSNPSSVPIFVVVIGRRKESTTLGMQRIRQAQLLIIAGDDQIHHAADSYDLELRDSTHPSPRALRQYGRRIGQTIAKQLYAGLAPGAPFISQITKLTNNSVRITFSSVGTLNKPTAPIALRIEDGESPGVAVSQTSYLWSGNNLTVTTSPINGTPVVFYPFDWVEGYNKNYIIYDRTNDLPVRSFAG
jgi:hypothetical protein